MEWTKVHLRPSHLPLNVNGPPNHHIETITVTKTKIITCDNHSCRLWKKEDLTLIDEHTLICDSTLYGSGKWHDDYVDDMFSFLGSDRCQKIENKQLVHKNCIFYLDLSRNPQIMAYYPKTDRSETIMQHNEGSNLDISGIRKMLVVGSLLLLQTSKYIIYTYDLAKKKFLHDFDPGKGFCTLRNFYQ